MWWTLLSISGYTNYMCVIVSAEQELLEFSEDTVFNRSSVTSFEQNSVDTCSGMSEIITEDPHVLGDSSNFSARESTEVLQILEKH